MGLLTGPATGEVVEISVTMEAKQRLVAGLSWDPRPDEEVGKKERKKYRWAQLKKSIGMMMENPEMLSYFMKRPGSMKEKSDHQGRQSEYPYYDLDLHCFIYDNTGQFYAVIDPSAEHATDPSHKIYHSGEDMEGHRKYDDEQIHIELKGLPDNLTEFVFMIESDCMHEFDKVLNPAVRFADAYTNKNFLQVQIGDLPDSNAFAFVFCRVFRRDDKWFIQNISEFTDFDQNWPEYLKRYL
ncbi:MAG: TerD family protein [Rhodospirillales bacterium]|nr:TerD family protein [Rhodospirillales bacterium]